MSIEKSDSKDQSRIVESAHVSDTKACKGFDFVQKYVDLLRRITDAPEEFQEAAALFLLSSAIGTRAIFRSIPETAIFSEKANMGGKPLNLWFLLLGKSRVSRKTSGVLSHVEMLCEKVLGKERLMSQAFTPEALVKEMSEKSVPSSAKNGLETVCFWISDEIAWFFQQLKAKSSYMSTADALLSKIYDGSTYSRSTIGRGKETIWNPYLTAFLASTFVLPTFFDELQVMLGFLNRFIFVMGEKTERKPLRTQPLSAEEIQEVNEIQDFLGALCEMNLVIIMEMTSEAKEAYDSFEEEIERQISEGHLGIREGYCGQLPNLVVRLSCLYRISRMTPGEIKSHQDSVLIVETKDVERAVDYARKAWAWFEQIIEIMQSGEATKLLPKEKAKVAIPEFLVNGSEKHVYQIRDYVIKRTCVSPATFYNALKELIRGGKIQKTKKGYYKLKMSDSKEHRQEQQDTNEKEN